MDNNFHIFPSETFIDLCLYQYGHEKCTPGHLFGPATRNHYLFHYVLSGTGTLMATNSKGPDGRNCNRRNHAIGTGTCFCKCNP